MIDETTAFKFHARPFFGVPRPWKCLMGMHLFQRRKIEAVSTHKKANGCIVHKTCSRCGQIVGSVFL